jgi:hypothetical protein
MNFFEANLARIEKVTNSPAFQDDLRKSMIEQTKGQIKYDLICTLVLPVLNMLGGFVIADTLNLSGQDALIIGGAGAGAILAFGITSLICDTLLINEKLTPLQAFRITSGVLITATIIAAVVVPILVGPWGLFGSAKILVIGAVLLAYNANKYNVNDATSNLLISPNHPYRKELKLTMDFG